VRSATAPQKTPHRLSSRIRAAVEARVRLGMSIAAAAEAAGMSKNGFHQALKRAAVQAYLREVQAAFVAETDANRAVYRVRALEAALDLMLNAKSEAVRARMVEFLVGDGKAPQVAVHVGARTCGGYEYIRPGERLIEITPADVSRPPQ